VLMPIPLPAQRGPPTAARKIDILKNAPTDHQEMVRESRARSQV
jgi:hypothetical protein